MQTLEWLVGGSQPDRLQSQVGRGNPEFSWDLPPRLAHLAVKRSISLGSLRGRDCLLPRECLFPQRVSESRQAQALSLALPRFLFNFR